MNSQRKISRRSFLKASGSAAAAAAFVGLAPVVSSSAAFFKPLTVNLQIFSTSDIHGKYMPYDYALDTVSTSGSMTQISSAINELRDEDTILIDVGDSIQGNYAQLFLETEEHPFAQAMNQMNYDAFVLGNHEFNYGMDALKNVMAQIEAPTLCGNVYNPDGTTLGDGYIIVEKHGVKVGIIGMVTSNITRWDATNLQGYTVTNAVEETRKIIDEIKDDVDILIAAEHMSENNEYDVAGSGAIDLAMACPELAVILAAHGHKKVEGSVVNGVLITENASAGQTISQVLLTLKLGWDYKYHVADRTSALISMSKYGEDAALSSTLTWADSMAKDESHKVIGTLVGGDLAPENEIAEIPQARIEETSLLNLINTVQQYYAEADVSAAALFIDDANAKEGQIRNCDLALIYKYENTLYRLQMNGAQLRQYMEWSAGYYNTYKPGDLTISFNPSMAGYKYDVFSGVSYEINIANEAGSRIENLRKADGTPVVDSDVFIVAVNNYRSTSQLLTYGEVFQEGDELPTLLEIDVHGDLGGVRELIGEYIQTVCGGVLEKPAITGNWKITGNNWDVAKHNEVVKMLKEGTMSYDTLENLEDGKSGTTVAITEADLAAAKSRL